MAYYQTNDIYNNKSISINEKLIRNWTVVHPQAMYAAEYLTIQDEDDERIGNYCNFH